MYTCTIKIWSDIGHTPITNRKGAYCDELKTFSIAVYSHEQAIENVKDAIRAIPHAVSGHYNIINYPNHNKASNFVR